ncbi:MAG: hypothetical protein ACJ8G3_16030, partial [Burkholderiaceae bacterium]
ALSFVLPLLILNWRKGPHPFTSPDLSRPPHIGEPVDLAPQSERVPRERPHPATPCGKKPIPGTAEPFVPPPGPDGYLPEYRRLTSVAGVAHLLSLAWA